MKAEISYDTVEPGQVLARLVVMYDDTRDATAMDTDRAGAAVVFGGYGSSHAAAAQVVLNKANRFCHALGKALDKI